ncbi:MAG: hypothetical protein HY556_10965 [Euryarchaeota archaeon]|nr:hypothetical protein [Euryarchaeota archaeon]
MTRSDLEGFDVDKAFYSVLKLHVYSTVYEAFLKAFGNGNIAAGSPISHINEARLTFGRFTARKTNFLFVPENGHRPQFSAEFYGFTSHKVREKLAHFNKESIVDLIGRGLRDAYTYQWSVPLQKSDICSFVRLKKRYGEDMSMVLETARIHERFEFDEFDFKGFITLYQDAHLKEYAASRWGVKKFQELRNSYDYEHFLKVRLQRLVSHGVIEQKGEKYRLSPTVDDAVNHFDLFTAGVAYRPSREMCVACPMKRVCYSKGPEPEGLEPYIQILNNSLASGNGHGLDVEGNRGLNGHSQAPPTNGRPPTNGAGNGNGLDPSRSSSAAGNGQAP